MICRTAFPGRPGRAWKPVLRVFCSELRGWRVPGPDATPSGYATRRGRGYQGALRDPGLGEAAPFGQDTGHEQGSRQPLQCADQRHHRLSPLSPKRTRPGHRTPCLPTAAISTALPVGSAGGGLANYLSPSVRELSDFLSYCRLEDLAPPSVARHLVRSRCSTASFASKNGSRAARSICSARRCCGNASRRSSAPRALKNCWPRPQPTERFFLRDKALLGNALRHRQPGVGSGRAEDWRMFSWTRVSASAWARAASSARGAAGTAGRRGPAGLPEGAAAAAGAHGARLHPGCSSAAAARH